MNSSVIHSYDDWINSLEYCHFYSKIVPFFKYRAFNRCKHIFEFILAANKWKGYFYLVIIHIGWITITQLDFLKISSKHYGSSILTKFSLDPFLGINDWLVYGPIVVAFFWILSFDQNWKLFKMKSDIINSKS